MMSVIDCVLSTFFFSYHLLFHDFAIQTLHYSIIITIDVAEYKEEEEMTTSCVFIFISAYGTRYFHFRNLIAMFEYISGKK